MPSAMRKTSDRHTQSGGARQLKPLPTVLFIRVSPFVEPAPRIVPFPPRRGYHLAAQ